jgi:uncharacterized RmlC-like cupin family protein
MGDDDTIKCIRPSDRVVGDPTPGMVREQAIAIDGLWSGFVRTEPGMLSGWHHHGDHDTSVFIVDGSLRMEFGSGGTTSIDAHSGDFIQVPKRVVHREGNIGDTAAHAIVTRAGRGITTVNVDGPEPSANA